MSTYRELTEFLFSMNRSKELKTDLSVPLEMAEKLGHPERAFPTVHVAGTNGKGTVAYKIARVLQDNGYRVGLFSSPHLFTYRERIQINGEMISEEAVAEGLKKILPLTTSPKFFEVTTMLAFDYFARHEVDVAVIEAGLGGRLDATNIITPLLSIITSVDWDHVPILGNNLEEIAYEKSGIIKLGIPCIIGKNASYDVIMEKGDPLFVVSNHSGAIARKALKLLPFESEDLSGLDMDPPCRYEKHGDLILDVAHNPAALKRLFQRVKSEYPERKIHVLFGMASDKDIKGALEIVSKVSDSLLFLTPHHPRLFPYNKTVTAEEGLAFAKSENAVCVVTGSFYIMKDLQPHLAALESPSLKEYTHLSG